MRDAKTPEAHSTAVAEPGFPEIDANLHAGGPTAAIDRLVDDLDSRGEYRLLLDALLLKARHELGLPLIQVGRYADLPEADRLRFEERYVEALRRVGTRFLEAGDVTTAWAYFQAIGEPGPVAKALDETTPPDDPDKLASLIEVAFHHGANPARGFEWILRSYGPCSAITSLEQATPADPAVRTACIEKLIRHLHQQLLEGIRADIGRRGQPQPPPDASIPQLIAGREWLFSDDSYHTDVSHLSTVIRWSIQATDPEAIAMAVDLAEYGRRLSPRLQYESAPPFERTFDDHLAYLKALAGRDVDAAVAHFRSKLENLDEADDDVQGTIPAQVLVNLLLRVGRQDEAVDVASRRLLGVPDSLLLCPPMAELCQRSGRLDQLARAAVRMKHPVNYLAARIQTEVRPAQDEPQS